MSINAKLDASRFFATLQKKAELTNRTVASVIKEQARLAAKEFINVIPPTTGATLSGKETLNLQKKAGEASAERDIRKVYMTKSEAYAIVKQAAPKKAKRFWKLIQTDVPAARNFIRDEIPELRFIEKLGSLDESLYKSRRSKRTGKVAVKYKRQIITDKAALTNLIKRQKSKVGTLKSGAYKAAQQAGIKVATPNWITSKGGSGVGKNDLKNPTKPSITLTVTVPYVDAHNRGNRLVTAVLGNRTRAMERDMDAKMKEVWKGNI